MGQQWNKPCIQRSSHRPSGSVQIGGELTTAGYRESANILDKAAYRIFVLRVAYRKIAGHGESGNTRAVLFDG